MNNEEKKKAIEDHFDAYAQTWHERLSQYSYRARYKTVKKFLQNESFDKVVDIGCGTGDYSQLFDEKKVDYLGIDISKRMIEKCRNLYPNYKFEVGDGESTALQDKCCNLVLSVAVLEYYDSPHQHMAELSRISMNGGTIIICVPNGENSSRLRDNKIASFLNPIRKFKKKIIRSHDNSPVKGYTKSEKILHKRYTKDQMELLGESVDFKLQEARFVNFQLLPVLVDQYIHFNPLISRFISSWGFSNTFKRYATIIVCKFKKATLRPNQE